MTKLKDKDIFSTPIDELSPEGLALVKERIIRSVERMRKARGEVAATDQAAKEAKAKKPKAVKNMDLES